MIQRSEGTILRVIPTGPSTEFRIQMPEWYGDALCAQVGLDMFFPEKGGGTGEAKRTCAKCPVAEQCLDYAIDNGEEHGVWGGKSARERIKIARTRGGVPCPHCGARFREKALGAHTWRCPKRDEEPTVDELDEWLREAV